MVGIVKMIMASYARDAPPPRFRTVRESPRHSLADRYLGPARQTARNPSAVPE